MVIVNTVTLNTMSTISMKNRTKAEEKSDQNKKINIAKQRTAEITAELKVRTAAN